MKSIRWLCLLLMLLLLASCSDANGTDPSQSSQEGAGTSSEYESMTSNPSEELASILRISEAPEGEAVCDLFHVTINGEEADVFSARASAYPYNRGWPGYQRPLDQTEMTGFVSYESNGAVTIAVTANRDFTEAVVRPLSEEIKVAVDGRTVSFTISAPGQYSLELDGHHNNLLIFSDPIREYDRNGENVIYYGPGVHRVGAVWLSSNTTVIVDRGAVVYGSFIACDADNVTICGGGIIDGSYEKRTSATLMLPLSRSDFGDVGRTEAEMKEYAARNQLLHGSVRFFYGDNCKLEGVICRDASTFAIIPANCTNLHIDNIKCVGMWRYNSDAIDIFNSHDVLIENSFLRSFDDTMVIKGIKGFDHENNYNITVRNMVIWCDWGRALEIGAETCADEYYNILFEDCDIIHSTYAICDIQNGDRAYVHDLVFRNIYCEYSKYQQPDQLQTDDNVPYNPNAAVSHPRLINITGYTGQWSTDGIAGRTDTILFENIVCYADEGIPGPVIQMSGYSSEHKTSNITIDGVFWNGKRLSMIDCRFMAWQYVENINFVKE
ncbi:MAG: hypothetical protein E7618_04395 [Ruminococcaceae bacterium]|nr:hypothetical protein [Oscillospiraceae bacterium]